MPKSQEYGMPDPRYRVLAVATHPVQYMAPIFRRMATHPALDLQVAYCTLRGAEAARDPEFGAIIQWDVPPRDGRAWKTTIKKILWPHLFRLADHVIVPSSGSLDLMLSLGLPAERVTLTPYSVDNDWWIRHSAQVDCSAVRA